MSCIVIAGLKNKTLIHNLCTGVSARQFTGDDLSLKTWWRLLQELGRIKPTTKNGHSFETCWIVLFLSQTAGFVQCNISLRRFLCSSKSSRCVLHSPCAFVWQIYCEVVGLFMLDRSHALFMQRVHDLHHRVTVILFRTRSWLWNIASFFLLTCEFLVEVMYVFRPAPRPRKLAPAVWPKMWGKSWEQHISSSLMAGICRDSTPTSLEKENLLAYRLKSRYVPSLFYKSIQESRPFFQRPHQPLDNQTSTPNLWREWQRISYMLQEQGQRLLG